MIHFPRTIRARLVLWYLGSTLLLFSVLLIVFGLIIRLVIHEQIDHHTHIVALEAKQIVEQYLGSERERHLKNLVSAKGMTIVLLSSDGAPILQTNSSDLAIMSEHQLQKILISSQDVSSIPSHFSLAKLRFASTLVDDVGGNRDILAVGYSTEILEQTLRRVFIALTGTILILVIPLGLLGSLLLKRFLVPLENIADTAKSIRHSPQLKRRVPLRQPTTELQTIAAAFNQMLEQLQQIFLSEHQFFADTAHGLKTPIAILRSRIEKLTAISSAEKQGLLQKVDDLVSTIADLLFFSNLTTQTQLNQSSFNLSNLISEFTQLAQSMGEANNIQVKAEIQPDIKIESDLRLVKRILSNIIHNAVTYTKKNGSIHVQLKLNQRRNVAIIRIKDTGIGIDSRDLKWIYRRFYRGRNSSQLSGSGLGLAIARTAIETLGGKIRISSKLNFGTTVTISLPISSSLHLS